MSQRNPWARQTWPEPIPELQAKLSALDAEVREHEICRPTVAQTLRLKASAVASRLEALKRALVRREAGE